MKFKMKSIDLGAIHQLINAVHIVSSISKNFVMRITDKFMYLIINERVMTGSSLYWCQINYTELFTDYSMKGLSTENNEIILELISDFFVKTLRQANVCRSLRIKLSKNEAGMPCFLVDIEHSTQTERTRVVNHEIPVRIVPLRIWDEYQRQPLPNFDVSLSLPNLRMLRSILDKMKNLTSFVTVTMTTAGELTLEIRNDQVRVRSQFTGLDIPQWNERSLPGHASLPSVYTVSASSAATTNATPAAGPQKQASVTIDIKRLFQLVNSVKVAPLKIICNVVDQGELQLYLVMNDFSIQSIISGVLH